MPLYEIRFDDNALIAANAESPAEALAAALNRRAGGGRESRPSIDAERPTLGTPVLVLRRIGRWPASECPSWDAATLLADIQVR